MNQLDFESLIRWEESKTASNPNVPAVHPPPAETEKVKAKAKPKAKPKAKSVKITRASEDAQILADACGFKVEIAAKVLDAFEGNLKRLGSESVKGIQNRAKVTARQAARVHSALEFGKRLARSHAEKTTITSPSDVADLMMSKMRYLTKEIVTVLCLDTKGGVTASGKIGKDAEELRWGRVLAESQIFEGTLNASVFHPREIFRFAIEESANSIVLCHNHPSGDPKPSQEDIRATKQLIEAGNQIGIKVLDHIIIGDGVFVSLKEENHI